MLNNILIASFSTASAAAFEKGEKNYNDFFLKFADYFNSFFLHCCFRRGEGGEKGERRKKWTLRLPEGCLLH